MLTVNGGLESVYLQMSQVIPVQIVQIKKHWPSGKSNQTLHIKSMKNTKGKIWKKNRKKSRKSQEKEAVRGRLVRNLELVFLGLKISFNPVMHKSCLWGLENVRKMEYMSICPNKGFFVSYTEKSF